MFPRVHAGLWLVLVCVLLPACATTKVAPEAPIPVANAVNDPIEPINRVVFRFNQKLDKYIAKPIAKGYRAVTPARVRQGVANFFSNLGEPIVFLNDALQGKFRRAASDLGRFIMNSTFGVAGLFDVATGAGLERHNEDLGQTFAVWGAGDGPYLVLPLLGPSSIRDGLGLIGDSFGYPLAYHEEASTRHKLRALEVVSIRERLLDAGDILDEAAGDDPYAFVREAHRQRRQNLVYDGAPPVSVDPSLFEDDSPAPSETDREPAAPAPDP